MYIYTYYLNVPKKLSMYIISNIFWMSFQSFQTFSKCHFNHFKHFLNVISIISNIFQMNFSCCAWGLFVLAHQLTKKIDRACRESIMYACRVCERVILQHCKYLEHFKTHWNTLQHTATHWNALQHSLNHNSITHDTATHCNTLQHTATYCNTA